jgi:hypothetical protein
MSQYRFIYWRNDMGKDKDGKRFANIHLLVGYNDRTIVAYQKMARQLRETFPQATDEEIRCEAVTKSNFCKSFSLIAFDAHIPEGEYPTWRQVENGRAEYSYG